MGARNRPDILILWPMRRRSARVERAGNLFGDMILSWAMTRLFLSRKLALKQTSKQTTAPSHSSCSSATASPTSLPREADVLFARRGLRLEEYCIENKIPYLGFDTFADIKKEIEKLREEDEKATQGRGVPKRFNPRANMWRRVSSQRAVPLLVAQTPSKEEKMFLWPEAFSEFKTQPSVAEGVAA